MPLEQATYVSELVPDWPQGTDPESQGDDHFRMMKQVLQNTWPNATGPINGTPEQFNQLTDYISYQDKGSSGDGTAADAINRWTMHGSDGAVAALTVATPTLDEFKANGGFVLNFAALQNLIYPVHSVLISTNSANPSTYLGFGTWTQRSGAMYGVGNVTDSGGLAWNIPVGAATGNWRVQNSMIVAAALNLAMDAVAPHTHDLSRTIAQNTSGSDYVGNDGGHPGVMSSSSPISSGGGHTPTGKVTIGSGAANTGSMMRSPGYAFYVWERTA